MTASSVKKDKSILSCKSIKPNYAVTSSIITIALSNSIANLRMDLKSSDNPMIHSPLTLQRSPLVPFIPITKLNSVGIWHFKDIAHLETTVHTIMMKMTEEI